MTLVLGASGQLGSAMRNAFPEAQFLTRSDLDLTDIRLIQPVLASHAPKAIINCAAYTDVETAEAEESAAIAVNCTAVGEMAAYAAGTGIPFVTFSTDYVFDGTATRPYVESDARNPINAYGRSKACGEERALTAYPDTLVIRTSWLISGTGNDFVGKILRLVQDKPIKVIDEQTGSPTTVDDLAAATARALQVEATGLLHLVNSGTATWYDLARAAAELAGLDRNRITPCSSDEFPTVARRPEYSVLGSERLEALELAPLPHWRDSLPSVIERLAAP
jgi:dTDP-4-dehydrorhamnose reductase